MQRQFRLPHRLRSLSARAAHAKPEPGIVDVVHLNGSTDDDPAELTFSTLQYAARLCARDRQYEQLAADLVAAPFVFVGTTLDEVMLWQQLERMHGVEQLAQPAFLVARSLSRARQALLASLHVEWIQAAIADIAGSAIPALCEAR